LAPWFGAGAQDGLEGAIAQGSSSDESSGIIARISRRNTAIHTVFLAILVVGTILYLTAGRAIVFLLRRALFVVSCGRCSDTGVDEEELNPPYTGQFYQPVSPDEAAAVGTGDDVGWALREDPYRGGGNFLKVKLWSEAGEVEGQFHQAGDPKCTWEVVKDSTVHSYRIDHNPSYREAVRVMRMALISLGIDLEGHDMSLPDAAQVADGKRDEVVDASAANVAPGDKYIHADGSLAPREAWGNPDNGAGVITKGK
jgi:hypothetical protein